AGHAAGDFVLTEIATLLKRHIRGTDIACRYGGEEFTLVLPNATLQSARSRAEAICAAIREEGVQLMGVTASLGVAIFPDHAAEPESLLRAADKALYDAKARGRNQVRICARGAAKVSPLRSRAHRRGVAAFRVEGRSRRLGRLLRLLGRVLDLDRLLRALASGRSFLGKPILEAVLDQRCVLFRDAADGRNDPGVLALEA